MNPDQIAAAAVRLGINQTSAPVESRAWEVWADLVRTAQNYDIELNEAKRDRDRAIAEANFCVSTDAKFAALRAALD